MTSYLDGEHWRTAELVNELHNAASELRVLQTISQLSPKLSKDGNQFCFLYGELPNDCIVGFGDTAYMAAQDFYSNFLSKKP